MGVSSLPSLHPLDALLFTFGHMHVPAPRLSATEHDAGAAYTPSPSAEERVRLSPWLEIVPEFLGQKCNVAGHTARTFHFALTLTPEHQIRPCCILGPRAQTLGPAPLPRAPCAESSYPSPSLPFPLLSPLLHFCPRLKVHPTPSCARRLTLAPGSVYICRTRSGQVQWPPRRHGLWSGA